MGQRFATSMARIPSTLALEELAAVALHVPCAMFHVLVQDLDEILPHLVDEGCCSVTRNREHACCLYLPLR